MFQVKEFVCGNVEWSLNWSLNLSDNLHNDSGLQCRDNLGTDNRSGMGHSGLFLLLLHFQTPSLHISPSIIYKPVTPILNWTKNNHPLSNLNGIDLRYYRLGLGLEPYILIKKKKLE